MTPLVERARNAGLALAIVAVTVGAVLGTAWLVGVVERAGRVGALERQVRTRPTVSVTVTAAPGRTPPAAVPSQTPRPSPPVPQPSRVSAIFAAAFPPASTAPAPTPGGSSTPPPRKPSPTPTPTPPVARACTVKATTRSSSACIIAAATVKATSVP